jgi:type IV pilus assembly protein PilM
LAISARLTDALVARRLTRPFSGRASVGPIGIDFGLESVHFVQLESVGGAHPTLRARATVPFEGTRQEMLSDPARFRAMTRKALASDRFKGRSAVIAVPVGLFRTLSINYKTGPDQDDAAGVLRVMQDRLDGDLSDFVIDFLPVKSRSKNNERLALVAVSERDPIVAFLEAIRRAGLTVDALEIGPVAISRLVGALSEEDQQKNVLVINSGRQASYLTLISGPDLLFDQQISFGENELIHQLVETLDLSETMARDLMQRSGVRSGHDSVGETIDESGLVETMSEILKPQFMTLVDEIKRVCLYAAAETRGGGVSRVYLLGSLARWPGADELLGDLADMDVAKIHDPLLSFRRGEKDRGDSALSPELAVATGLALRGSDHHG